MTKSIDLIVSIDSIGIDPSIHCRLCPSMNVGHCASDGPSHAKSLQALSGLPWILLRQGPGTYSLPVRDSPVIDLIKNGLHSPGAVGWVEAPSLLLHLFFQASFWPTYPDWCAPCHCLLLSLPPLLNGGAPEAEPLLSPASSAASILLVGGACPCYATRLGSSLHKVKLFPELHQFVEAPVCGLVSLFQCLMHPSTHFRVTRSRSS
jgi:hypothetical protein